MIIQKITKDCIRKVAKKHGITEEEAIKIWECQWKLVHKVISETPSLEPVDTIKLPKWGRYYTGSGKINMIKTKIKKKLDNERLLLDALDITNSSEDK